MKNRKKLKYLRAINTLNWCKLTGHFEENPTKMAFSDKYLLVSQLF
jgi:hypothetical protein